LETPNETWNTEIDLLVPSSMTVDARSCYTGCSRDAVQRHPLDHRTHNQATARLIIPPSSLPSSASYIDLLAGQCTAAAYAEMLKGNALQEAAIQQPGYAAPEETPAFEITVQTHRRTSTMAGHPKKSLPRLAHLRVARCRTTSSHDREVPRRNRPSLPRSVPDCGRASGDGRNPARLLTWASPVGPSCQINNRRERTSSYV